MLKLKKPLGLILFLLLLPGCSKGTSHTKDTILMDTFVRIEIRNTLGGVSKVQVTNKAIERMKELEGQFNYFSEDSELAKINSLKEGEGFFPSDEMFRILKESRNLCYRTNGLFDVTVAPLLEIWFSRKRRQRIPDAEEIKTAMEKVGIDKWVLDEDTRTVSFKKDGMKINLGGIAKGFIVDRGIDVLRKQGVTNALINAGGDMHCLGGGSGGGWSAFAEGELQRRYASADNIRRSPSTSKFFSGGGGWRVGVRDPADRRKIIASFTVGDKGVATSGGYERFIEFKRKKFSHIIDPRTGYPVEKILKSVTVVANDCMTADGLATTLDILSPHEGLSLIEGIKGVECIIVDEDGRLHISSGLKGKVLIK